MTEFDATGHNSETGATRDVDPAAALGAWDERLMRAIITADAVPAGARLLRRLSLAAPVTAFFGVVMQLRGRRQPGDPRSPFPSGWNEWGAVLSSLAIPVGIAAAVYALASLVATYGARLDLAIWDTVEQEDEDEPAPTVLAGAIDSGPPHDA